MSRWRLIGRCLGLSLVGFLVLVACVSSGVRLAAWQSDRLSPWVADWLGSQLDAETSLEHVDLDIERFDPRLTLDGLTLDSRQGRPLLTLDHVTARLDTRASWERRAPVVRGGNVEGMTLHLYQTADGGWAWPDGAGSRWFGGEDDDAPSQAPDVDAWLETLLRQQVDARDVSVVLHGDDSQSRLTLSQFTLASREGRASIQARMTAAGDDTSRDAAASDTVAATLHVAIDGQGGDSPQARFTASADLSALSPVLATLTAPYARALGEIAGEADLSGRWASGGLRAGRLRLDVPELRVVDTRNRVSETLENLRLEAGLNRTKKGEWQAWIDDLALSHPGLAAVDWPRQLQARSTAHGWWLRSGPFALDGMTDYLRYLPLPFDVAQPLIQLDPKGQVQGLELGQDEQGWYAEAALEQVSVSAWNEIPGGGPLDAWATYRDRGGRVVFAGGEGTDFALPTVYAEPLDLSRASGVIDWHLTPDGAVIEGSHLRAGWRGASAEGSFGLTLYDADDRPGAFQLDLSFANADARGTRVLSWLPTRVIDDPALQQWFSGDIGGIVKHGELGLSMTLSEQDAPEGQMFVNPDDRFTLGLDIADGRLQYAPEWPALERVYGHLQVDNMNVRARVDHATSHGLTTRDAVVTLADKQLLIDGSVNGTSGGLLDFLAHAPLDAMSQTFALWQSEGALSAKLHIGLPMTETSDAETDMVVNIDGKADIESLTFPELQLTLENINGDLGYRRERGEDYVSGTLGARVFDGPLLARFAIGGERSGIDLEGRALGRGLLQWGGLGRVGGLLSGFFPYRANIAFDAEDNASLTLRSDLEGLGVHLPAPFGKSPERRERLAIDADIAGGMGEVRLADWGVARWRTLGNQAQGQVWLEGWPGDDAAWPSEPGWYVLWRPNRLDTQRWAQALSQLQANDAPATEESEVPTTITDDDVGDQDGGVNDGGGLKRVALSTPCILVDGRCLGGLQADAAPLSNGWRLSLDGEIAAGQASWQPDAETPIDVDLTRLNLDALTPKAETETAASPTTLMEQIEIAPHPAAMPSGLAKVPPGHVRIAQFQRQGQQFGPLEARWQATGDSLTIDPLTLSLGELDLAGTLGWERAGSESLSRAQVTASGGNVGTAFRVLAQPAPVTSESGKATLQLTWPGAPWQFALPRASGRVQATLNNGRLRQVHSSSAKLVGLFNIDNILRRVQLDFSDVTDGGTAFNTINGDATLYNGILKTEGPLAIDGTSTHFTLAGSVDLNRQTLDQRLGITVPVSQNLPLVAVMAGAPQVGVGLFVFHKLFGQWLDNVTQIYYRIEGPWSSPNINLESAE